jgi:hypothetical protein
MKNGAGCIHHWWIDSPEFGFRGQDNRFYVKGECQKCSEERLFISEFADVDYVGAGSHQLGSIEIDIDSDKVSHRYEWRPRDMRKFTGGTGDERLAAYEVEGCGYACVDSLNCPYEVCIHDNSRVARTYPHADLLTVRQRAAYIRTLGKRGYTISEIIKTTGAPYKIVWRALSTSGYKASLPGQDLQIIKLRKKGYTYSEISSMMNR